jgi:prepilin-type N-terminal cleavage/methylation domain-containing protein
MQPPRRPSCARAFTLVELLVVVTLLAGLLTAFAVFSTKPDSGRRVGLGMQSSRESCAKHAGWQP